MLDIFFEALNYEAIEQKKAYDLAGLLGDSPAFPQDPQLPLSCSPKPHYHLVPLHPLSLSPRCPPPSFSPGTAVPPQPKGAVQQLPVTLSPLSSPGDIGGQMGLFIGASILTILEILDYIYEVRWEPSRGRAPRGGGGGAERGAPMGCCVRVWGSGADPSAPR